MTWGFRPTELLSTNSPDGRAIPGTFADVEELEIIGREVSQRGALFQSVGIEWEHMRQIADRANPRMLFNATLGVRDDGSGVRQREELNDLARGKDISGVAQVRGCGALIGLQALIPFSWRELVET